MKHNPLNPTRSAAVVNWLAAFLLVVLFFGIVHQLERDSQAAQTLDAMDAAVAATEARIDRAARALCRAELGTGSVAAWTPEGRLVCTPAPAQGSTGEAVAWAGSKP